MNRREILKKDKELLDLYEKLIKLYDSLGDSFLQSLDRLLPVNELLIDRWDKAKKKNFGKNTNVYDSAIIIGNVIVGMECWIGPNTMLDGSGGLTIGNYCTISAGVHIYTHDNVKQTLSSKKTPIERGPVVIGDNVYIGPNSIIIKNLSIGNYSVVGAGAFVNKDVPPNSIVIGQPAKVVGRVEVSENGIKFIYE